MPLVLREASVQHDAITAGIQEQVITYAESCLANLQLCRIQD